MVAEVSYVVGVRLDPTKITPEEWGRIGARYHRQDGAWLWGCPWDSAGSTNGELDDGSHRVLQRSNDNRARRFSGAWLRRGWPPRSCMRLCGGSACTTAQREAGSDKLPRSAARCYRRAPPERDLRARCRIQNCGCRLCRAVNHREGGNQVAQQRCFRPWPHHPVARQQGPARNDWMPGRSVVAS